MTATTKRQLLLICCGILLVAAVTGLIFSEDSALRLIRVDFINAGDEIIDVVTNCSYPKPTVELEDISTGEVIGSLPGTAVTLRLRGIVRYPVADMVKDNKADITEVFVEGLPGNPVAVSVVNVSDEQATSLRPYPFKGRFETTVVLPISMGDNLVRVRATDSITGRSGSDSVSVRVLDSTVVWQRVDGKDVPQEGPVSPGSVSVINHASSESGFYNPIRIRITDPTLTAAQIGNEHVSINYKEYDIKPFDDGTYTEVPVVAVSGPQRSDICNVFDAQASVPITVSYRGIRKELHWAYATHRPANEYHYATVKHNVYSSAFNSKDAFAMEVIVGRSSDLHRW
jgi:hypothetical protein